ncbi:MAG: hypothetical protein LBE99_04110 [Puniceicoccales bacterium]|jgi:hypothetical protein|nr:hypothetical protein [Puniceicoccales bacterium]
MQIKYVKLGLLGLIASQVAVLATPADFNGPLVQMAGSTKQVHPLFTEEFLRELHALIGRGYRITLREEHAYDYKTPHKLYFHRIDKFVHGSGLISDWFCHRPFMGTHGAIHLGGMMRFLPHARGMEADYPGFIALRQATETTPPVIVIVFRGSQSNRFQNFGGIFGPSWLTNLSAAKMNCPENWGFRASFHKGFLEKYLSARPSIFGDLHDCVRMIPRAQRPHIRFIITGHSQGAGICLPAALDIVHTFGPRIFGEDFSNITTPRFFVYALSGPNSVGTGSTKRLFNDIVGRDNVIRHSSILDIVTHLCLGKHYDRWLFNRILGATVGMQAGYTPVGHLAIDDLVDLLRKGFTLNGQHDNLRNLPSIAQFCLGGYHRAMLTYQSRPLARFSYKGLAAYFFLRGGRAMGGMQNFIAINHYGSFSASNTNPIEMRTGLGEIGVADTLDANRDSCFFDSRLPECNLNACLGRGEKHRSLSLGIRPYTDPSQVFTFMTSGFEQVGLEDSLDVEDLFPDIPSYASDAEYDEDDDTTDEQ